jgi:hypothetical protein
MGKLTGTDAERQPSGRGSQGTGRRRKELVDSTSPFPAVEGVPAHPRWYQRIRGVVGMSILVTVIGVLTAVAFTVLVVLLAVVAISTIA